MSLPLGQWALLALVCVAFLAVMAVMGYRLTMLNIERLFGDSVRGFAARHLAAGAVARAHEPAAEQQQAGEEERGADEARGGEGRLQLVQGYLDEATVSHFLANTTVNGEVKSAALSKTNQYLLLDTWNTNSYPKVELK